MTPRPLLPFALLMTLAAMPAQERAAEGVLLLRHGAGDLVPNAPLIEALLADPALRAALVEVGASPGHGIQLHAQLPVAHLPGTCQIHLLATLWASDWSDEKAGRVIDLCADHLRRSLTALLCEQPRAELTARADDLRRRCGELAAERAQRIQRRDAALARHQAVEDLVQRLEQQLLAAQIDVRTEQRAMEQLDRLVEEHRRRRDEAAAQQAGWSAKREALRDRSVAAQQRMTEAEQRLKVWPADEPAREALPRLLQEVAALQAQLRDLDAQQIRDDLPGQDAQRLLAATLEQMPLATLALQRATARLASIEEQHRTLLEQLTAARRDLGETQFEVDATEPATIDLTVWRQLLTEVQGKLARLEPVRLEVLRR